MNPDTNQFEHLTQAFKHKADEIAGSGAKPLLQELHDAHSSLGQLLRPDGSPVPAHWSVFTIGEPVVVKNYTFKVAYIGEGTLLLEPVGPVIVGEK